MYCHVKPLFQISHIVRFETRAAFLMRVRSKTDVILHFAIIDQK